MANALKVDIEGMKEIKKLLKELEPTVINETKAEMKRSAKAVEAAYRRNARKNFGNGALDESIEAIPIDNGNSWEVGSSEEHAVFIEFGTRAHPITPRNARLLSFFWEKIGKRIALPFVAHPGTKAYLPLTKAWNSVMRPLTGFYGRIKKRLDGKIK